MTKVFVLVFGILLNAIVGGGFAALAGLPFIVGSVVLNAVAVFAPLFVPAGCFLSGIYTEVWTGEMVKQFRSSMESLGWIAKIRSYDQYAQHNVIHFVELGGDPDVLVNNSTYPLQVQTLQDADKAIGLDMYQSRPTPITDDELHAICYDKMASVLERHSANINEKKFAKAIHAIAPASHTATAPVLATTGAASPDGGRLMITRKDIIAMKAAFDKQKIPVQGRVLVLCPDHAADLLDSDQKFVDQYHNYQTGKIGNLYGFEVYEYTACPYFTAATKAKVAFGTAPTANDVQASVAFFAPRIMKATGETIPYLSEAKHDPINQQNLCDFRHYFICLPLKSGEAIGAIISALP